MRNLEALADISAEVLKSVRLHSRPGFLCPQISSVVAISGAAALGKTVLARELAVYLNNQGVATALVGLDGYLWSRKVRESGQLSGYDPRATNMPRLLDDLRRLIIEGEPVDVPIYDHRIGNHAGSVRVVPREVVLLDGIRSMDEAVRSSFVTYGIFLSSEVRTMRGLRLRVDIDERGYSVFDALDHADNELKTYSEFIDIQRSGADLELFVGNDWSLTRRRSNEEPHNLGLNRTDTALSHGVAG